MMVTAGLGSISEHPWGCVRVGGTRRIFYFEHGGSAVFHATWWGIPRDTEWSCSPPVVGRSLRDQVVIIVAQAYGWPDFSR